MNVAAQDAQVLVKQVPFVGSEDDDIQQIVQDSTGLLWMISYDKWYTSDGEKITELPMPFQSDDGRYIRGLYSTSPNGNFYLGGDSVRVFNPYSRSIIQSIGIEEGFNLSGQKTNFHSVIYASDSIIWALVSAPNKLRYGTAPDFVITQSRSGLPFKPINAPEMKSDEQNMAVREDQLFISTLDTIFQYDNSGRLEKVYAFPLQASTPIAAKNQVDKDEPVNFLHYIQDDNPSSPGNQKFNRALYSLDASATEFRSMLLPDLKGATTFRLDQTDDYFWLQGQPLSLLRFSPDNGSVVDYSEYILEQNPDLPYFTRRPLKVFQDRTRTLWVSMENNGVFKLSSAAEPFSRYLAGIKAHPFCENNTCLIRSITSDKQGNIYFAYDIGIQKLDHKTGELSPLKLNLAEKRRAVYSLSFYNQKLYLDELEIDPATGNIRALIPGKNNNHITHFIDKEKGQMWIADAGQPVKLGEPIKLYHYDLKKDDFKLIAVFDSPATHLNQVSQLHFSPTTKTLFMATTATGMYELNMDGSVVQHIADSKLFGPDKRTLALYEDNNQQLWIGHTNGLSRMDLNTQEITKIPLQTTGLFDIIQVYSIQPENNIYFWLGTDRGLYRLNVETGELRNFKMFPAQSRTEFNRLSTYQDPDGTLYFGSVEGLFVFHPDTLVKEARLIERFPVRIHLFSRFDNEKNTLTHSYSDLAATSTFDIYPHHKYFSFEVFVPDFRDTEKNTYTWWLEGYENSWSLPSNSNTIRYDNLLPGEYTLYVRGGISADYYKSSERQWQIIVHQVWYKTWWAYWFYISVFLGLVYLFYRYQVKEQLEKAEAIRLEEFNSLKSRFYTNITHEFRTPLTVIMGMTDNIRGYLLERKLIQRNSKNLLQLINQLLDLSKLESGSLKMDFIQADIVKYLQYLTESFYSIAEEKKIHLTFYPEVKEMMMDYDEVKIQHIVHNLVTNALKFTPEEGKIIIHLQQMDRDNQAWLQIKVSDTGIGISEENLPRVFDRFYQVDTPSNLKVTGAGIGLSFTKELVEMMNGKITVNSKLGAGTDFLILLPAKQEVGTLKKERNDLELAPSVSESVVPSIDLSTLNQNAELPSLLIIEDNQDVITYIESLLKGDYNIEIARNGVEGIDKALEMIPDIIISDVIMSEKDGYEVCKALKNDERSSHIPIILLTVKATSEDRIEGLKVGADAYLTKPFSKEELFIRLNKLIELRKALQERYSSNNFLLKRTGFKTEPSLDNVLLQKLIKVVQDSLDDQDFDVVHLCRAANLSNMQVNRKLKALTGKTPSGFIRSIRLQKAMELLQTTQLNISQIAYEVGFSDPYYFSRSFSEEYGRPPSVMRK